MFRSPIPTALSGAIALLGLTACFDSGQAESRPSRIVFISMDTVRADHVTGYGELDTTPNLDRIAKEGVRFERFYGASTYTIPSTMSIMTGLDPREHAMDSKVTRLSPDVPMLAELMRDAGYRTQAFHEGGYVAGRFGFERGFQEYREVPRIEAIRAALPDVTQWMRDHADEDYFLFFHTYAAHFPYGGMERYRNQHPERGLPTAEQLAKLKTQHTGKDGAREDKRFWALCNYFAEKHEDQIGRYIQLMEDFPETEHFELDLQQILTSYDERIHQIDRAIGELRATLEELGQWEDTLFMVFSDHGEAFFEHGLERHDYVPFNECLELPFFVSYPNLLQEKGGRVIGGLTWHLDLVPTVLGIVGEEYPGELHGKDLTAVLLGEEEIASDRAIFPAVLRPAFRDRLPLRRVVIQGDDKWIEGHEHFGDEGGYLFDLSQDPLERRNLREERRERFDELASLARTYNAILRVRPPIHQQTREVIRDLENPGELELSAEEWARLAALGYAGPGDGAPEDHDEKSEEDSKEDEHGDSE